MGGCNCEGPSCTEVLPKVVCVVVLGTPVQCHSLEATAVTSLPTYLPMNTVDCVYVPHDYQGLVIR